MAKCKVLVITAVTKYIKIFHCASCIETDKRASSLSSFVVRFLGSKLNLFEAVRCLELFFEYCCVV